jgi:ABC-type transport system substrate-binding protein
MAAMRICLPLIASLALAACGPSGNSGPVNVAIIGEPESLFDEGIRLSSGAQHLAAATHEGLVALDPSGQIIPAIAERWIVTDDGLSYIFRLRDSTWPDEEEISAEDVRNLLRDLLRRLEGTSLGLDLAKITEVRAMTGRVIEIRLSGPMPEFLRLLAQPELGLVKSGSGAGPMVLSRDEEEPIARLSPLPPQARGFPARDDWEEQFRQLTFRALPAGDAVQAFSGGDADLLLNGTLATFPMAQLGPLSRGNIQVDPALGVLGLVIRSDEGILANVEVREALSMAIDRTALISPFGLGGWQPTTWIVPPSLFNQVELRATRWSALSIEQRRELARARIADWQLGNSDEPVVRVALPDGPGSDLLFTELARFWRQIGVSAIRVEPGEGAELELRDRLARYSSPRWFLNQFHCGLEIGLCSADADELVESSLVMTNIAEKERRLAEAHAVLVAEEVFIPLGAPVRWSLVRGAVSGYQANQWGLHPLFPLSEAPI